MKLQFDRAHSDFVIVFLVLRQIQKINLIAHDPTFPNITERYVWVEPLETTKG